MKGRDSLQLREPARQSAPPARRTPTTTQPALAALQRQIGNRAVARLLNDAEPVGKQGGVAAPELSAAIAQRRGRGRPLGSQVRTQMEQQFNTSFDDVSVHHDREADTLARSVSARAFTTGSDIFLSQQAASSDRQLLAHELTHVVQQRSLPAAGPLRVTAHDDSTEREAERNARQA